MKYTLIIIAFLLTGCNPCKYVSKHPECFPSDTIKITSEVIKYVKEYVTNDSIVYEKEPCDPITNTVIIKEIVYKTNWKTIIDTIYTTKETSKINPINIELKKENQKLVQHSAVQKKIIISLLIAIGILLLIYKFFS